jgi:5-methylcytosine-specific restriction endonuclease McrA
MPPHFNLYGFNRCGHEILFTMDHIIPKSEGGSTSEKNLQLLCEPCNALKRNHVMSLSELRRKRKRRK